MKDKRVKMTDVLDKVQRQSLPQMINMHKLNDKDQFKKLNHIDV